MAFKGMYNVIIYTVITDKNCPIPEQVFVDYIGTFAKVQRINIMNKL
jgi:hypothetical protein